MDGFPGQSDSTIRLAIFIAVFAVMALIELGWPKRTLVVAKGRRWLTNLGIAGVASVVLRLMAMLAVPVAAVAAAGFAQAHQIGLLNHLPWPEWLKVALALLVLDLAIWAQHLVSHKVPLFWRLHQVHHADRDIDVTTAIREPEVSSKVSAVSTIAECRANLVARQRAIIDAAPAGIVAEGRDITTVVAPDADVRLLLTADPEIRMARRQAELGDRVNASQVADQVLRRDADDSTVVQFHVAADGVTTVDSSDLDLEQTVQAVLDVVARVAGRQG